MRNDARTAHRTGIATGVQALHEKRRQEVIAMLGSCGIDPRQVPLDTPLRRNDGSVFLEKYVLTESGQRLFDPERQGALVEDAEIRPPAHLVPDWLPFD